MILEKAYAKINLTLDVTGKLPNGYHSVKMVMQSVELHDDVILSEGSQTGIKIKSNLKFLPNDNTNLAVKAANAFFEYTKIQNPSLEIELVKRIPVAAGLAGGSSNAAAVLRGLNKMYNTNLSVDTLCEIGVKIGADVPYCIKGGSMLAEGIGEILTPLTKMPECFVIICKPDFSVVTAKVYAKMNGGDLPVHPDTNGMIHALEKADYDGICHRLYNVMEEVTGAEHEEISQIEDIMLECGCDGTVMSGSGPTVFGLFRDENKAKNAENNLKKIFDETFLTKIRTQNNF